MRLERAQFWVETRDADCQLCGPLVIWLGGIAVPALMALYGLAAVLAGQAVLPAPNGSISFQSGNAVLFGIGLIALAMLFHRQCFWDSRYGSTQSGARCKFWCMLAIGVCVYALCVRMILTM